MHSIFFNKTDFRDTRSWGWLRTGDLKKATEGKIMAAQEKAIRTRMIRPPWIKRMYLRFAECVKNGMRE